jgi:hypothetical protein
MKVFRHSILISALPLLLLAASCDLHTEDVAEEGTGTIVLNITSPDAMQTRHADDDDSSAASDGGIMKTLCIWLVRTSDDVILEHKDLTPNAATATAEFKDVARGNYYFCVLANYKGLDGYEAGEKIDDDFKNALVSAQATNSTTTTTTTTTLAAGQAPSFENDGMPLSYVQTIDVAAGKNVLDVSLKRCVGRLTINLRNTLSNYDLFVHSLNISENNQTQGYLFPRLGSTDPIPSTSSQVAFPDLTSLVEIDPKTQVEVYDYYLYETNPETALTINMLAALYPINTSVSSVKVNSRTETDIEVGGNTSAIVGPTYYYMIRSGYSSNYYLVDNGSSGSGSLGTDSIDSDSEITSMSQEDLKKYLWTFSGSTGNSTTVMNVSTGNFLTISSSGASLSSASETLTTKESSQYGVRLMSGNYNMTFDGTSIGVTEDVQNNKQILWYVRPVREGDDTKLKYYFENPTVELARGYHEIKYLDVYGAPQPLTKIDRNEHVTLNISLFYNTELAQFDFAVSDWTDGGNRETTFD